MRTAHCLSDETLQGLGVGLLSAEAASPFEEHLCECVACAERMRSIPTSDPLVAMLPRAKQVSWSDDEEAAARGLVERFSDRRRLAEQCGTGEPDSATVVGRAASMPAAPPAAAMTERAAADVGSAFPDASTYATVAPRESGRAPEDAACDVRLPFVEGTVLGSYRLERKLGEGGMGAVWKAFHTKLKKNVAIKVLRPHLWRDAELVARFEREIEVVGRLDHPAIVRAMDAGECRGSHYLVMEYVHGQDLARHIQACGPRSVGEACDIVRQAAAGLAHAHRHGLVHRDIKPSNLFLTDDGQVKILDLGLARLQRDHVVAEPDPELTDVGQVLGTPDYMAPEQWESPRSVGPACDLYALGCTLFHLLTGRPPFHDENRRTWLQKMRAHLDVPAPSLSTARARLAAAKNDPTTSSAADNRPGDAAERRPSDATATASMPLDAVPPGVEAIYQRLMAKAPAARFASADDLVAALTAIENETQPKSAGATTVGFAAKPSGRDATTRRSDVAPAGPRPPSRSWSATAWAGLVVALLLGVLIITIKNQDGTKDVIERPDTSVITITGKDYSRLTPPDLPASAPPGQRQTSRPDADIRPPATPRQPVHRPQWPADAPKPAVAPYDAARAERHQQQWADYLKVPVEHTNSIGMRFRLIPPGEYRRGSTPEQIASILRLDEKNPDFAGHGTNEGPAHTVVLTRPIYLGATEVTQSQYQKVTGRNPSAFQRNGTNKAMADLVGKLNTADYPVETVSWFDAVDFCVQLSRKEGLEPSCMREGELVTLQPGAGYRVPTEAEWEHACRAGTTTLWWFGDDEADLFKTAWYAVNAGNRTHAVAGLKANPFGLHDVHGNLYEWVHDVFDSAAYGSFHDQPAVDPTGPPAGGKRGFRGGYWEQTPNFCRSAIRAGLPPTLAYGTLGFRVALAVDGVRQSLNVHGPPIP